MGAAALDIIDWVVYDNSTSGSRRRFNDDLEEVLVAGGSLWTVGDRDGLVGLERRVPEGVQAAAVAAMATPGNAGSLLSEAWHAAFGINPDYEKAYSKAVKAVEAAAVPVVSPSHATATLGTVITQLRNQGDWKLGVLGQIVGEAGVGRRPPFWVVSRSLEEEGLLLSHSKARLASAGRLILVQRVLSGRAVSHVAKEMGVSRQCAHRWVSRFRRFGAAGLLDRSSRHHWHPATTPAAVTARLLELRRAERLGRDELARRIGVSPSTASRIIARAGLPALHELDPVTGIRIRASRRTNRRYEREQPGDLIHIDVKKLGRIPDGGGWRLEGPATIDHNKGRAGTGRIGFDYVHVAVDDHSRLAFARALPDEKGATCAAFLVEAAAFFAGHGITVREVMTDNALNYRRSRDFRAALSTLGAEHVLTRPYSPWQNGKAERFHRTLQEGWAYRRPFTSNQDRTDALEPWLDHYNYARAHTACNGQPPISRASPTK